MSDLISRQDAILALLEKGQRSRRYKLGEIWELNFDEIREALETVPSAYPKNGKWIKEHLTVYLNGTATCSECGGEAIWNSYGKQCLTKFCPNCGADMRGESE